MGFYNYRKTPWWMTLIIVVLMTPVLAYPSLLHGLPGTPLADTLVWLYPAYVIATGICAWLSYPQRPFVTWLLLVMLVLTHIGMFILVENT